MRLPPHACIALVFALAGAPALPAQTGASPVVHPAEFLSARAVAAAESANVRNGHIDSAAAGLLHVDTARVFSYRSFASRLIQTMVRDRGPDSNTVVSPASAGIVLSLAAAGARGPTEHAMLEALGATHLTTGDLARRDSMLLASMSGRSKAAPTSTGGIPGSRCCDCRIAADGSPCMSRCRIPAST